VGLTLETSYIERDSSYSLWGLLVNSGYLTVKKRVDANTAVVKIPNNEVMSEFQVLIAEIAGKVLRESARRGGLRGAGSR
ncbi:MAG TPA: hypothetical protein IAA28_09400, partial [Candidatus Lachnoclostridium stercoripullorum]|nr:hypothetical protein [Candidatus Lachnoclostridium stercoripullorum]